MAAAASLGPRARKKLLGTKDFEQGIYNIDITSMTYKILNNGSNPYKCCFASAVSRSPRTNPIHSYPETQKPENTHFGPGYYMI